ncbi:MAG: oligopeptide transporter, OPT family [Rhabdochlamydiaceae bacterium]|nr:oligopeptide transporter, OPT family [Candidatus Amphrikana amoebophyrae]
MSTRAEEFQPHVPSNRSPREFSLRAIILGMCLGLLFGVGNAYLGLKIGTTISASIPAAVMSMAILRTFFKRVTILENNIVQTVAAVGEGLAAGVIFTIPALFFLGDRPSQYLIFFLSMLGGLLGILFMIPLRRYIIVKEHGKLPFPEGTACAEILKAGEKDTGGAKHAAFGLLIGAVYKLAMSGLHYFQEVIYFKIKSYKDTLISFDCTPALLGVGFIIGPRITSIMFAGGALAWWVLIPLIKEFGSQLTTIYPSTIAVADMSALQVWDSYIRYIGAGTVAIGGILNLVKIIPVIRKTISGGMKELFKGLSVKVGIERTDRDISLRWLILGSLAIILILWLFPAIQLNLLTVILITILGFFFVCVTSITVGIVGSTSNPASGMTITTLLITCIVFVLIGWTERVYLIAAITMSAVVNVAITLASTTSQDLKTGFLLGATPKKQQIAEMIGLILPGLAIGGTVYLLNEAYGLGTPQLPAPQATLMALIAKGVILQKLPIVLVMIGVVIGLIIAVLRIPVLPFAIGLYLPLSLSTSMALGGLTSFFISRKATDDQMQSGILASSGLVAGDACMGVIVALLAVLQIVPAQATALLHPSYTFFFYLLLVAFLVWIVFAKNDTPKKKKRKKKRK